MNHNARIYEYDFIKCLCAIGIIVFHYSCHTQNLQFRPLYVFQNGSWGGSIVTTFFMVSGALLSSNSMSKGLKSYYIKRIKAIYPAFYLVYFWFFIIRLLQNSTPYYKENAYYIFTILGVDGYVENTFNITYYIVGEWFLGAIIICYLLFPVFYYLMQKSDALAITLALVFFVIAILHPLTNPDSYRTISSCMFSMVLGSELQKHIRVLKSPWLVLSTITVSIVLMLYKLPISDNIPMHIMGVCLFVILFNIGTYITSISWIKAFVVFVSKISFIVFLVQHQIILKALSVWQPTTTMKSIFLLCSIIVSTIVIADVFSILLSVYSVRIKSWLIKRSQQL